MAVFASGLDLPEGPYPLPDGRWLLVEMGVRTGRVTVVSADGRAVSGLARTGRPNAVVAERNGVLWVAESHPEPALLMVADGTVGVAMTDCAGLPLLFPNDLVFGPDGMLYLTDSGVLLDDWAPGGAIRADYRTAPIDGRIFRIDTRSGACEVVDRGIAFANGIAVAPDGDLYANEMITGEVFRYPWDPVRARYGPRESFANVLLPDDAELSFAGPDGMTFGADGRLFCTVYGGGRVAVVAPDGKVLPPIPTAGRLPTNVSFGPAGARRLFVTECELGQIEVFDLDTCSAQRHDPEAALRAWSR
ncbi:SMP-30/gluconolactonase/LRE family protein [Kribbella sp. NPDC026611]|uniref:SMP-30/gluconolactonase/LRE family protein n=1 Tax=Kribbella sp. NPDC026611 TaxID=3154911 RepID=UPI0033EE0B99